MKLKQLKPNLTKVIIGASDFYFSYETLIAFHTDKLYCSENQWSVSTGKHLNEIEPDKSKRIKAEDFNALVNQLEQDTNLSRQDEE